jgi:hypothetical protein
MRKIAIAVLAVLAASSHAEIVKWGAAGGKTNIVTSSRPFIGSPVSLRTFNTASNANPIVGASYYPSPTTDSRYFSAAYSVPAASPTGMVEQVTSGDRIAQYATVASNVHFKSMILWDVLTEVGPFAVSDINMEVSTRSANGISLIQLVIEQGPLYYISDIIGGSATTNNNYASINIADASALNWYAFTPFNNGISTIGFSVDASVVLNGLTGIGYYADTVNGGATSIATGANMGRL